MASLHSYLLVSGLLFAIGLAGLICAAMFPASMPWIIAPVGASAVLLFAVPSSPLAQPWPIVGGNAISAIVGIVVAQAWLGQACPLTTLEMWLRRQAGEATYGASFIEYWVQRLLYYEAPSWVFTLAYSLFALGVAAAWWYFPPRRGR